ncbi:MAG: protein-export chaperone SecB [Alphaproteobacteria bacterium]|nr:protein-export chaperone SecB [Alphaproteobacteria bacterium]
MTQPITVNAQYVKDLSFESPLVPHLFAEPPKAEPRVDVAVNVQSIPLNDQGVYEVTLRLKAENKVADRTVFICELAYAGVFTLPKLPEAQVKALLMVDCPALLFPFARSIVAATTQDGGFPPLLMAPINFSDMLKQNEATEAAKKT